MSGYLSNVRYMVLCGTIGVLSPAVVQAKSSNEEPILVKEVKKDDPKLTRRDDLKETYYNEVGGVTAWQLAKAKKGAQFWCSPSGVAIFFGGALEFTEAPPSKKYEFQIEGPNVTYTRFEGKIAKMAIYKDDFTKAEYNLEDLQTRGRMADHLEKLKKFIEDHCSNEKRAENPRPVPVLRHG